MYLKAKRKKKRSLLLVVKRLFQGKSIFIYSHCVFSTHCIVGPLIGAGFKELSTVFAIGACLLMTLRRKDPGTLMIISKCQVIIIIHSVVISYGSHEASR